MSTGVFVASGRLRSLLVAVGALVWAIPHAGQVTCSWPR